MANTQIISVADRITDEQRRRDQCIRIEQTQARREMDEAIKASGTHVWVSGNGSSHLPIHLPQGIEEIFGYPGVAHLIGFYLAEGECYYNDGCICSTGELDAFLLFLRHWIVAPRIVQYQIGVSDEAQYWLMVDRQRCLATIAPVETAQCMVEAQWQSPEAEQVIVDGTSWTAFIHDLQSHLEHVQPPNLLLWEMHRQARILDMISWLNEHAECRWKS